MRRLLIVICCLLTPAAGLASNFRIIYDGGTSSQAQSRKEIRLYVDSNQIRLVKEKSVKTASAISSTPNKNVRQSGAAVGLGGLELGICARTTVAANGENRRSITVGFSVAKPLLPSFDLRVLWFQEPSAQPANAVPAGTHEVREQWELFPSSGNGEHSEPVRCTAPA